MLIGYMRVSSGDERQSVALQRDALLAAGVDQRHLHQDRASGARDDRPGLKACLTELCEGDVLVVWKLDRLGRSLSHLIRIVEDLKIRGVALCLAALYESWTIPIAVLLAMPVGVLGALLGAVIGDQTNGVYFQVGLLTVVGLTGKNGIMIVEFARERMAHTGGNAVDAVLEAAKLRFRPILMTSLAFGLGVVPLIISSGAGVGARHAIGYVINISRGSVVCEDALLAALSSGSIKGAGLDVFAHEPAINPAFFALENVVLQPHIASATTRTREAMWQLVIDNLISWANGSGPITPIQPAQVTRNSTQLLGE